MRRPIVTCCLLAAAAVMAAPHEAEPSRLAAVSPIFGVSIPDGCRRWQMVNVAQEAGPWRRVPRSARERGGDTGLPLFSRFVK